MADVDFSDSDLTGANLSVDAAAKGKALNLRNVNLTNGFICKTHISESTFDNSLLVGSNLTKTVFENCSFRGANFRNANLIKTEFINCDLRDADFIDANLLRTEFSRVRMHGVRGHMDPSVVIYASEIDISRDGPGQYDGNIDTVRRLLSASGAR
ncbi:pentapeptide repeat-containing protein [Pendulispora brunnea]|uniref:Pentapeptide repeat-containing protein n=2 Tax=Pendulispora brunnea TaxID=2905690 RepID=A0ABZ2KGD4_9BACT